MSQHLFSKFRTNEFERLHRELAKIFDIQQADLQTIYAVMRTEFDVDGLLPEKTLPRCIFRSHDPSFQRNHEEALVVGIDIPCILELNDGVFDKKTVVILAQDPLRKSSRRVEGILVGTPYTIHQKSHREKGLSSNYFKLIKVLLDKGYRVYLTDIFKLWVSQPNKDEGIPLCKQDGNRFLKGLKAELEIFDPLAIITWGQNAGDAAKNLNLGISRHLEFPHPSGAANGTWAKLMGKPPTRENKVEFWSQRVSDYL